MRDKWRLILDREYSAEELLWSSDRRLATRLGVFMAAVQDLSTSIFDDLSPSSYGVAWWTDVPTQARILIGDYLFQAVTTIQKNVIEARYHFLELQSALDEEDRRFQDARFKPSGPGFMGPPSNPQDELSGIRSDLHVAGLFRGCASALDCMAAAVVGVLGWPQNLIMADWSRVQKTLTQQDSVEIRPMDAYERRIEQALGEGPTGWMSWLLRMRNTYVHRSRQINLRMSVPLGGRIFLSSDAYYLPFRLTALLPKYPGWSDVEVWKLSTNFEDLYIMEDAEKLLASLLASLVTFLDETAAILNDAWSQRRAEPSLVKQPYGPRMVTW